MNFGGRPARILDAKLEVPGTGPPDSLPAETIDARPFSTTCVRHEEVVRFASSDTIKAAIGRLFREARDGAPLVQPLGEQHGRLCVSYSESTDRGSARTRSPYRCFHQVAMSIVRA